MKRRQFLSQGLLSGVAVTASSLLVAPARAEESAKKKFSDKTVLITGATSGIGEATAHAFAEAGAKVVFCGRREKLGHEVQENIRKNGGIATYVRADVREEKQVRKLLAKCKELYGGLDIAYNNAGVAPAEKNIQDLESDEMMDVMATNFLGVFYAMKYEIPLMLEKGGVIINCGSYSSDHGHAGFAPYVSSKHALAGITKAAALELATKGITVNSINPYCVETPMLERRAKLLGIKLNDLASRRPSRKMSKARDVAELVMYLASPENRILHGQALDLSMGRNIDF